MRQVPRPARLVPALAAGASLLAVLAPATLARAAEAPGDMTPSVTRSSDLEPSDSLGLTEGEIKLPPIGLGAGVDTFDKNGASSETLLYLRLAAAFRFWRVSAGLNLHLRIDDDAEIRKEDIDEASDWLSFIDYVQIGEVGDTVHARVGRLRDFNVGHGTIVGHYYSDTDLDSPLTGVAAGFNWDWFGAEYMANDLTNWNVQSVRAYATPLFWTDTRIIQDVIVGATFATDITAPSKLRLDANGLAEIDDDNNLKVREDPLVVYGFDLELPILVGELFGVSPYGDYNFIGAHGSGGHVGLSFKFNLPLAIETSIVARAEYRVFQSEYIPTYFDAFYEIERFRYPGLSDFTTKRSFIRQQGAAKGYYGELRWVIPKILEVSASYEDIDGQRNDRLDVFAQFTGTDWLRVRVHYHKRNLKDPDRIFSFDDQTFLSAHLLLRVYSGLYADVSFTRTWVLDQTSREYTPVDVYSPGILFVWEF